MQLQNKASINAPGPVVSAPGVSINETLLDRKTSVKVNSMLPVGRHQYAFEFPIPVSLPFA